MKSGVDPEILAMLDLYPDPLMSQTMQKISGSALLLLAELTKLLEKELPHLYIWFPVRKPKNHYERMMARRKNERRKTRRAR